MALQDRALSTVAPAWATKPQGPWCERVTRGGCLGAGTSRSRQFVAVKAPGDGLAVEKGSLCYQCTGKVPSRERGVKQPARRAVGSTRG